jgi:hypothetical protein
MGEVMGVVVTSLSDGLAGWHQVVSWLKTSLATDE